MAGGFDTFICDNLCLMGSLVWMRKHTTGLVLEEQIAKMVGEVLLRQGKQVRLVEQRKQIPCGHPTAQLLAGRALMEGVLPAAYVRDALVAWADHARLSQADAPFPELCPRTLWSFQGAFTRFSQKLRPHQQIPAAVKIGNFFDAAHQRVNEITGH
jgi:hypothetical protein